MSRFLSLKLLATDGSKSRAVTRIRAVVATGAESNLMRHFSLGQALGVNLVEAEVVNFNRDPPGEWEPNDPSHNNPDAVPSIAMILNGCGFRDGTDAHEAIYTMMHLHGRNKEVPLFAPINRIPRVLNYYTGAKEKPSNPRFMLQESARMTWEKVNDLEDLRVEDHQGLIIPGGGGVYQNLTNFRDRLDQCEMDNTLNQILLDFYRHRKPIGFIGDAAILAARVFQGVHITLGRTDALKIRLSFQRAGAIRTQQSNAAVERMGAILHDMSHLQVLHDPNYHIYTTASRRGTIIKDRVYYEVSSGIRNLVDTMLQSLGDNQF